MPGKYKKIKWQEEKNGVNIDCSLDIAIHPSKSNIVLLIVPGVDGSVDGYNNKYVRIAERVQAQYGPAVVRIANPFITSFHWESNIRRALEYIEENALAITGTNDIEIRIMAHSAGASIVAHLAWEYPNISRLLLINPASKLSLPKIQTGLLEFNGTHRTILIGSNDPSYTEFMSIKTDELANINIVVTEGADHHFTGNSFQHFIEAPELYLFN